MTEPNRQSEENEERIIEIEIEIERLRPFKDHPFQVKDDKEMFLLQESIEKYLLQVRKFYPMSIRRALHCFHICLDSVGWVICNCSAAFVKLCSFATVRK